MDNINLGDKTKFVGWKINGVTNCLELCKMILRKYGLTNFGNSNNTITLLKEINGKLEYATKNPNITYRNAIKCIDKHLENKRPIIVGVNHTIDKGINEGTTDHFVVIYGKEYKDNELYYLYYEVGKGNIIDGYNDAENRFKYENTKYPAFYDEKSNIKQKRFDVIQIRPNDGTI